MTMPEFPAQGKDESTEQYAERKREWARKTSEWIQTKQWIDYPYLPKDKDEQHLLQP